MFRLLIQMFLLGCLLTILMVIALIGGERNLGVAFLTGLSLGIMVTALLGALAPEPALPEDPVEKLSDTEKALYFYRRSHRPETD